MRLRKAKENDCKIIFDWRNDPLSQEMSTNSSYVTFAEHYKWFHESLINPARYLFIGEIGGERIGISRFDFIKSKNRAYVSINLNPKFRGKGLSKEFLNSAIDLFETEEECLLCAKIKVENIPSKQIFEYSGFKLLDTKEDLLIYQRKKNNITFKEVNEEDEDLLFDLLKNRTYSISHISMPTLKKHREFVRSNPYLYWYLIFNNNELIGSFYIKDDNSIGINIINPSLIILKKIISYIKNHFSIVPEIPSKVPPYFFINVPESNEKLYEILKKIGCKPIQTSFKINN